MKAGDLNDRITLQRHDVALGTWPDLASDPTVWAAVEPQGEERYRIRIRYRADLRGLADALPTMRVLWNGRTLDVDDVVEFERHKEVHLIAHQRLIEDENLETGARRKQTWP